MSKRGFRVVDVIVADDFRQENNGKVLVVGMYLGSILGLSFPLVLPALAFLTKWRSDDGSLPEGAYRILDPDGKVVAQINNAAMPSGPPRRFILAANKLLPVRFEGPGSYRWTFTPKGGRSITLTEFMVALIGQVVPPLDDRLTPTS